MNYTVVIDWKLALALGVASVSIILANKIDAAGAKEVSIHAIDACREFAIAVDSKYQAL
jgi:hypothetical protein